ncbi:hypothetical protein BWQ96_06600 [Gracilariopsis chorda]|uniref:Transposase domain-containing protein n=1 Tax=Gracilariopsis chorda TaxID=448386 RepID=A0A2V3INH9_9FLOR|nr:hypothetical protein BWQ96_06600 [Gracilariopsis chorda]|eukprot:PXF43641.1 hypothetical protein BWQ96_06600 [Gracilariopsis chorda]
MPSSTDPHIQRTENDGNVEVLETEEDPYYCLSASLFNHANLEKTSLDIGNDSWHTSEERNFSSSSMNLGQHVTVDQALLTDGNDESAQDEAKSHATVGSECGLNGDTADHRDALEIEDAQHLRCQGQLSNDCINSEQMAGEGQVSFTDPPLTEDHAFNIKPLEEEARNLHFYPTIPVQETSAFNLVDLFDEETYISEYGGSQVDPFSVDGAVNITEEDFAEEMFAEPKIFSLWMHQNRIWIDLYLKHNVTQVVMDDILNNIKSPYRCWKTIVSRMCRESGIARIVSNFPKCPSHMCFYHDTFSKCSVCDKPRPVSQDTASSKISWITLHGRLQAMLKEKSSYEKRYKYFHSSLHGDRQTLIDFFYTESFRKIAARYCGVKKAKSDIFLSVSTDWFQAFRNQTPTVWPIAAIICNLTPCERFLMRNVVPYTFIPVPSEPEDLQSFLGPLVEEWELLQNTGNGTECLIYDGTTRNIRVHMISFTGNLPTMKKVSGVKGHNGKLPCRYCTISRIWSVSRRHYYFPTFFSTPNGTHLVLHPSNLALRTENQTQGTIRELHRSSGQRRIVLHTETGISKGSILFRLPSIMANKSFPIDIMHLF